MASDPWRTSRTMPSTITPTHPALRAAVDNSSPQIPDLRSPAGSRDQDIALPAVVCTAASSNRRARPSGMAVRIGPEHGPASADQNTGRSHRPQRD